MIIIIIILQPLWTRWTRRHGKWSRLSPEERGDGRDWEPSVLSWDMELLEDGWNMNTGKHSNGTGGGRLCVCINGACCSNKKSLTGKAQLFWLCHYFLASMKIFAAE